MDSVLSLNRTMDTKPEMSIQFQCEFPCQLETAGKSSKNTNYCKIASKKLK